MELDVGRASRWLACDAIEFMRLITAGAVESPWLTEYMALTCVTVSSALPLQSCNVFRFSTLCPEWCSNMRTARTIRTTTTMIAMVVVVELDDDASLSGTTAAVDVVTSVALFAFTSIGAVLGLFVAGVAGPRVLLAARDALAVRISGVLTAASDGTVEAVPLDRITVVAVVAPALCVDSTARVVLLPTAAVMLLPLPLRVLLRWLLVAVVVLAVGLLVASVQ